jgi:hypothetical protein
MSSSDANSNAEAHPHCARRTVRIALAIVALAFIALNTLTLVAIAHNNRLEHYPMLMDATATYAALAAGVLILAACWFATTKLRPPAIHLAWILPAACVVSAAIGQVGAIAAMRPLFNSAPYDAAVKEIGDTFVNAAKLTDDQVEASKLISRVASDDAPTAEDLRAAINACDTLITRLIDDTSFLESWPQVCRDIMKSHGISNRRIRLYVIRAEEQNATADLLESNAQLAMLLQARKLDLRGRLATLERGAATPTPTPMPTDDSDAGSINK